MAVQLKVLAILCGTAAAAVVLAIPARAAAGTWTSWTMAGGRGGFTGTESAAGSGFPGGTFTSDTAKLAIPTGASAFLNASTPPGLVFGSSQGHPYLNIETAKGNTPSTTTLTFDPPAPSSDWAFVLGDVDADQVQIRATGPSGAILPVPALGFQSVFNYCNGTPRPSSCGGTGTDKPAWDPATGTLKGNGADTSGASGWFAPSAAVTSLTFRFSALTPGTPVFQLWLVSLVQPSPSPSPAPTSSSPAPTSSSPAPTSPSPAPASSGPAPTSSPSPSASPSPPPRPPSASRSLIPGLPPVPVTG